MQSLHKGYIQKFEVKDVDVKTGTFIQAFTRYNVVDSDGDRGRKGMFAKTWRENKSRIRHLLNHDTSKPLGETVDLWEDDEYAYGKSIIGKHDQGLDFIKMVESNLIKEASYGYNVIKSSKLKDGTNELLEVKQWEWSSLTSWGANEYTPVISLQKGMGLNPIAELLEDYYHKKAFVRNTTATDEAIQMIEKDLLQIESYFGNLLKGTEAAPALQPQLSVKEDDYNADEVLTFLYLQKQSLFTTNRN